MRIHSLQHVPFEALGSIEKDLAEQGHTLTTTHWYNNSHLPELDTFDVLIVMGGPMGVYDDSQYPWLALEKILIAECIASGKKIIGICLGAQLIACVLGAKVMRNAHREIGWFPLTIHPTSIAEPIAQILLESPQAFHWHGDTFELPANAQLIASSAACAHQVYVIGQQIYGFQCHLEMTQTCARALISHCAEDLDHSIYVQDAKDILSDTQKFLAINQSMSKILAVILKE